MIILSRRLFALGTLALPGCTALGVLNDNSAARDTYELQPITVAAQGSRTSRSLLVLMPSAPAAIATDRILIRQDPLSVAYLPEARWSDQVPQMLQSVLVRSLASAGRIGFVGAQGAGPVPDRVLLTRIDAFGVDQQANGSFLARVSFELTVLRDRDQRVLATRRFEQVGPVTDDRARGIVPVLQGQLDGLLSSAVPWILANTI